MKQIKGQATPDGDRRQKEKIMKPLVCTTEEMEIYI